MNAHHQAVEEASTEQEPGREAAGNRLTGAPEKKEKKEKERTSHVWLQDVHVEVIALTGELADLEARSWSPHGLWSTGSHGLIDSVHELLDEAMNAATGRHPLHRRFWSWWNGECIEAAYRHVHRAEAEIAKLYDDVRANAVIPEAVARLNSNLPVGDPRREDVEILSRLSCPSKVQRLSRAIQIGHEAKDQSYAKIRRFRNIINSASVLIALFLLVLAFVISIHASNVPLCATAPGTGQCPAGRQVSGVDVWIVVLLGLLGGSLAAAVSIRNIRGAPTPYNLATSLALLKVPSGALTAVGGLILLNAPAPALSIAVNSQQQLLAYALLFGYSQQVLTRLIDQRAIQLATAIPTKNSEGGEPITSLQERPPRR